MSNLPLLIDGRPAPFGRYPDNRKPTQIIRVKMREGHLYDVIINASTPRDALHDRLTSALGSDDYEYVGKVFSRSRSYRIAS